MPIQVAILSLLLFVSCCQGKKENEEIVDYRLPRHLVPSRYKVELIPLIDPANFIFGTTEITVDCVIGGSSNVTLHAFGLEVIFSIIV